MNERKTVFITVYDGDIEKNFLRSGILGRVVDAGFNIVLLVRAKAGTSKEQYYRDNFESQHVTIEPLQNAMTKAEAYWYYFSWNSLPTRSSYVKRRDLYLRHRKTLRYFVENVAWALGHIRIWREFVRFVYYALPDDYGAELFGKYRPALLFAPNMFSADDCRLIRAARKRGILTLTTAKSWDVPTTRGFTRVKADRLLTFNDINRREIIKIGDYAQERVSTVGFPQFDIYTHKDIFVNRDEFFTSVGANPKKNLILFAAPGDFKNPFTDEILQLLDDAINAGKFVKPVQILARFHPKYPSKAEHLANLTNVIKDRPGTYFAQTMERALDAPQENIFQWTFTDNDLAHLANSLKHSAVTINTESTMTLDAIANDRPVVLIGFDGKQTLSYDRSIIRNYSREHLQNVLKTGGAPLATTFEELVGYINRYLEDETADATGRERIKHELLFGNDGKAAERIAGHIIEMARNSRVS